MENLAANPVKIYLKTSDKARLADIRVRIIKDTLPQEPCDYMDLVFEKAEDESFIPANALMKWKFDCNHEHEPMWFFTTADRCKTMVSEDPSFWTPEKLAAFANEEKQMYQYWYDGMVYGYIVEKWDAEDRSWKHMTSCYGFYGPIAIVAEAVTQTHGDNSIVICIDNEEMKYEFDNTEKRPNEFDIQLLVG